jgi:hypothetical protein
MTALPFLPASMRHGRIAGFALQRAHFVVRVSDQPSHRTQAGCTVLAGPSLRAS